MSNNNNNSSSSTGGIGFCGLLTVLFIALKLTGYIDWSWWWVWSPMLIGGGISLVIIFVALVIYFWASK